MDARPSTLPAPKRQLLDPSNSTVLCFGDSLTAGYAKGGNEFHPYATSLQTKLSDLGVRCTCIANGGNGARVADFVSPNHLDNPTNVDVCGREYSGLRHSLMTHRPRVVIIMAGTNDLAMEIESPDVLADSILRSLAALHQMCHDAGASTIACSVPPNAALTTKSEASVKSSSLEVYVKTWKALNNKIRSFCAEKKEEKEFLLSASLRYFDVSEHVPYFPGSAYWGWDCLHMSANGYDRFGEMIAPTVANLLVGEGHKEMVKEGGITVKNES